MQVQTHPLISNSTGTQRSFQSLHYGTGQIDQKIYIQASLHADEVPGMLVAHHLRALLNEAEEQGLIQGSITLVPFANPIGLAQHAFRDHLGRFDLNSGENFNRAYPDFYELIHADIEHKLTTNAHQNKIIIREAIGQALADKPRTTELDSLRLSLLQLSYDSDWVLDLHCDFEALLHLYYDTPYQQQVDNLARYLGAETVLFAEGSGGSAFDEAQSGVWYRLRNEFQGRSPIPLAGCGVTVELRGERDVSHELASRDAQQIYAWMQSIGVILGDAPSPPAPHYVPTPLAGCETLKAPCAGVLVFLKDLGTTVQEGDTVAEIIDPKSGVSTPILAGVTGKFFARENRRYAIPGMDLGKIAGNRIFRTGSLLGA